MLAISLNRDQVEITEIVQEARDYDFYTNQAKANFQCLQAYLVLEEIASIYSPFWIMIASIFGPALYYIGYI